MHTNLNQCKQHFPKYNKVFFFLLCFHGKTNNTAISGIYLLPFALMIYFTLHPINIRIYYFCPRFPNLRTEVWLNLLVQLFLYFHHDQPNTPVTRLIHIILWLN